MWLVKALCWGVIQFRVQVSSQGEYYKKKILFNWTEEGITSWCFFLLKQTKLRKKASFLRARVINNRNGDVFISWRSSTHGWMLFARENFHQGCSSMACEVQKIWLHSVPLLSLILRDVVILSYPRVCPYSNLKGAVLLNGQHSPRSWCVPGQLAPVSPNPKCKFRSYHGPRTMPNRHFG